jgi:nucleotide-binding universal stress UspA family protein
MSTPRTQTLIQDAGTAVTSPRLVFGDDGSEAADVAWLWISEHAWSRWQIDVLTAEPPWLGTTPIGDSGGRPRPWNPPHPRHLHITGPSQPSESAQVAHLLARADPRLALGDQRDAQLIVIGHRGRGLLKAMTLGSTADWLLHRPPAPLAIIRSGRPARRILLCCDGSDHARAAVAALAAMPWIAGCGVTVLGVSHGDTRLGPVLTEAAAIVEQAGARPELCRREALTHRRGFDVRATVLDVIHDRDPDLVALGTRGLGLGHRLLAGSVATAVAHHAPCSVLTVMAQSPDAETINVTAPAPK